MPRLLPLGVSLVLPNQRLRSVGLDRLQRSRNNQVQAVCLEEVSSAFQSSSLLPLRPLLSGPQVLLLPLSVPPPLGKEMVQRLLPIKRRP